MSTPPPSSPLIHLYPRNAIINPIDKRIPEPFHINLASSQHRLGDLVLDNCLDFVLQIKQVLDIVLGLVVHVRVPPFSLSVFLSLSLMVCVYITVL